MINLYDSKCTDFNNNGLVVLSDAISCTIVEELNGLYELTLEYPLDTRGKWQHLLEGNIIKADGQLFRIYHKVKNLTSIRVNARHIFYDLLDNFLEDVQVNNLSGSAALDWMLTHTQYAHPFTNLSDVGGSNTKQFVQKNPVEAIMDADSIISTWGGELVRDVYQIKLLEARGLDRGVLVAYGKNIEGIEETLDMDGICTRIYPTVTLGNGAVITLPEKYVDSPLIDNYPHPKIKGVEFDKELMPDDNFTTEVVTAYTNATNAQFAAENGIAQAILDTEIIETVSSNKTLTPSEKLTIASIALFDIPEEKVINDTAATPYLIAAASEYANLELLKTAFPTGNSNIYKVTEDKALYHWNTWEWLKTVDIIAYKETYNTAYTDLTAYITPLLSDMEVDSDIDGEVFRDTFRAYYDARAVFLSSIAAKTLELANITLAEANIANYIVTLRGLAEDYFVATKCDLPEVNYKIDFLELSKTEEYKGYAVLESVYLGDTVTIRHSRLNIDLKAKVIKTTQNTLTNRLEKVELGSFKQNIATGIDGAINDVRQEIIKDKSDWQKAVDNATNLINTALGGFVVKRAGELLIMDTEDINTAVKVWRWNINGLGYSSTGYAGPFALAMTMDGQIIASFISGLLGEFVELRANQIILGEAGEQIGDDLIRGSEDWNNAVQQGASYNHTYIDENGMTVKDLSGGEVVTVGEMGYMSNLYGIMVKNALNAAVVKMGKIATGLYGIRADHEDGSYTQLTQNGLERFVGGESYPYQYETYVVSGTTVHPLGYGDLDKFTLYETTVPTPTYYTNGINVQLPTRFNNKNFKAFVVYSGGILNHAFAKSDTYVVFKVNSIDHVNAVVNVIGYATSYWNDSENGYYWDYADDTISTFDTDWRARRTNGLDFTLIVTL